MFRSKYVWEIKVFKETRYLSQTTFKEETAKLIKDTKFYPNPRKLSCEQWVPSKNITFIYGGSASTAYKYADGSRKVAVLNFADAIIPGGCVEYGAPTQEENLCRCTNLYESIVNCNSYYYLNSLAKNCVYTDSLIYSPDTVIFRDDLAYTKVRPRKVDIITCPAPATSVKEAVILNRIEGIIKAAINNNVKVLVLGAWGCGAFGQDPVVVGRCFAKALNKYNAFEEVVFAIRPTSGDWGAENKDLFEKSFNEVYAA